MEQYSTFLLEDVANLQVLGQGLYSIHWNLVSPHFLAIHKFTDDQHAKVLELVDELAERVRAIGPKIPTSLTDLFKLKTIPEVCLFGSEQTDYVCLCNLFTSAFEAKRHTEITIKLTGQVGDLGTQDILIKIEKYLAKLLWLIRSQGVDVNVDITPPPEVPYES